MKPTTYHVEMTDGTRLDLKEQSAAIAMMSALKRRPGRKISNCYAGLTEQDAYEVRKMGYDKGAIPGVVEYEIPPHDALSKEEAAKTRPIKADATESMFDEGAIIKESEAANMRRWRDPAL